LKQEGMEGFFREIQTPPKFRLPHVGLQVHNLAAIHPWSAGITPLCLHALAYVLIFSGPEVPDNYSYRFGLQRSRVIALQCVCSVVKALAYDLL
jgi:hypothetical protein